MKGLNLLHGRLDDYKEKKNLKCLFRGFDFFKIITNYNVPSGFYPRELNMVADMTLWVLKVSDSVKSPENCKIKGNAGVIFQDSVTKTML